MYLKKSCIALSKIINASKIKKLVILIFFTVTVSADSFIFNTYSNHGVVGLINMPTARMYEESVYGLTFYDGTPDQRITLSSNPFNWMEASFFYTSLQNQRYCLNLNDPVCRQDAKDKGFNLKLKIKEEGIFPAIAIGFNDIAGTGYYSSEYIVGSYGINNLDIHFGLGWGTMNSSKHGFKNPLGYISDNFFDRPSQTEDEGGQFQSSRYFSGQEASPFFGIAYSLNKKILMKFERDTTAQDAKIKFDKQPSSEYSLGIDYAINDNFSIGLSHERGAYSSVRFIYKNNPTASVKKYKYKKAPNNEDGSKYSKFIKNLKENGIGVNKISETNSSIGVELTQFFHSD